MLRKCFVPHCKSLDDRESKSLGLDTPLFQPPEDYLLEWSRRIGRKDKRLSLRDFVCADHFISEDILTHYEITLPNGQTEKFRREKCCLKRGAVPVFGLKMSKMKKRKQDSSSENVDTDDDKNSSSSKSEDKLDFGDTSEVDELFTFKQLHDISHTVVLPGTMWGVHKKPGGKSAFIHINEDMVIDKTVEFDKSCVPVVKVKGVLIDVPEVKSKNHLECLLRAVDAIKKPPKQERTLRKRPEPEKKTPKPVKKTPQVKKAKVDKEKSPSSRGSSPSSEKERSSTPEKRVLRNRDKTPSEKKSDRKPRFAKKSTARPVRIVTAPVIIKEEVDLDESLPKEEKNVKRPSRGETSKSYREATESEEEDDEDEESSSKKAPSEKKEAKKNKLGRPRKSNQWEPEENLSVFGVKCIISCCQNSMLQTKSAGKNVSYYRFPMDEKLADKWKDKCKLTGRIPKSARICSDHFKKEDFEGCITPGSQSYKRNLKPKAVPSVYLMMKKTNEVKKEPKSAQKRAKKSNMKIVETKTIEKESSPEPSDESEPESPSPPQKAKEESSPKRPSKKAVPVVELSDESSEDSDIYEEVIQVRITNMSADSTDSESNEAAIMKKRRKVLKKRRPHEDKYKDYDVETFEIELKSDDSDPEIRQMKKTLDAHLSKPKAVPTPPVKTAPPYTPVSKPIILTPARTPVAKPSPIINKTILQKTPRFSHNGVPTPQATPTGPKSVHWNITPKEQNGNKVVFEVNRTEKAAIPVKAPSLPGQSLSKLLNTKNKPDKDTIIKIIEQKITENYDIVNTKKVVKKSPDVLRNLLTKPEPKTVMKSMINDEGKIVTQEVENTKVQKAVEVQKAPEMPQINDPELDESQFIEITNDQIEFVSSEDIIIEETQIQENEKSDPSIVDENQIVFVCHDEDNAQNEKIEVPIENQDEKFYKPQTISIQRKSGSEVIPNKLKIPATEHSEQASKAGKEFLDTFFFNNPNQEVIFGAGEMIGKPTEIQELLQQNEVDFSKVLILNDSNVQWSELNSEQMQGNQLYLIRQDDDGQTSQEQNQSFNESQFDMECLEVEVIPPESAS